MNHKNIDIRNCTVSYKKKNMDFWNQRKQLNKLATHNKIDAITVSQTIKY